MEQRKRGKRPQRRVVDGHHPLMYWLMVEWESYKASMATGTTKRGEPKRRSAASEKEFLTKAGLGVNSLQTWRKGTMPNISNFDAACNILGYRLTVVPLSKSDEELP